jgi:SAM-dependent methyltransferase
MDMQIGTVAGEPFDLAVSQFGVMFFDQPTKAFGNIGAHLRPGGRLVFICWQSVDRNPWHIGTALAGLMPAPPPPAPGASPVGPFTLGDPARTASLLTGAGFIDVSVDPRTTIALAPASAIVDTTLLEFMGVPPGARAEAAAVIGRHLAQFEGDGTTYAFPLAYQVVTAVRP